MNKKQARLLIKDQIKLLDKATLISGSKLICQKVAKIIQDSNSICIYNALPNEVCTQYLIDFFKNKCKVYMPVVVGDNIELVLLKEDTQFKEGMWGIQEPIGKKYLPQNVKLDVCITPLLGFDKFCNRLGKGKGFYDRFFALNPNCYKIGLALECQKLATIQSEDFDIAMDCIVTEQGVYYNENNQRKI